MTRRKKRSATARSATAQTQPEMPAVTSAPVETITAVALVKDHHGTRRVVQVEVPIDTPATISSAKDRQVALALAMSILEKQ